MWVTAIDRGRPKSLSELDLKKKKTGIPGRQSQSW
jgi:hypothetical protein